MFLVFEHVGYDGYYGDVEIFVSSHRTREGAEKKIQLITTEKKEIVKDYLDKTYEGGKTYPRIWGGFEGAKKYLEDQGKSLFIREVDENE